MEYVKLGNSDLNVSRICMGCMGFDDCYAEGEVCQYYTIWTIYNGAGENIGEQFPSNDSPNIILEDLDGDGIDEMICPLQYNADGGRDVFIYRNNNGTIERGTCNLRGNRAACEYDVYYDEETDQIIRPRTRKCPSP